MVLSEARHSEQATSVIWIGDRLTTRQPIISLLKCGDLPAPCSLLAMPWMKRKAVRIKRHEHLYCRNTKDKDAYNCFWIQVKARAVGNNFPLASPINVLRLVTYHDEDDRRKKTKKKHSKDFVRL